MNLNESLLGEPLEQKSVVDQVLDRIVDAIILGELKPGDKIPTEMELSQTLGVGRNSVREAIKILSAFGVLYIKRSEGTFVSDSFNKRLLDPMLYGLILEKDSVTEIMELRQVFEVGILYSAIDKATKEDINKMYQALEELEKVIFTQKISADAILQADISFHKTLVAATDNYLIANISEYIDRITIPSRIRTTRKIMGERRSIEFIELHKNLINVIENRKKEEVVSTVEEHYRFWRKETSSYI